MIPTGRTLVHRRRFCLSLLSALLFSAVCAVAQGPFPPEPSWVSTDGDYSTGAALVDLNQDGWLDLVVANGNDGARQRVVVYYNRKDGTFPAVPDWRSVDMDYNGRIAVADVDGDGFPDVAVSVYIGPGGFAGPGHAKIYMNHQGVLESSPSWRTADSLYTFSCAFGDANGDGRPDLAVAGGEAYGGHSEQSRLYLNVGGRLDSLPSWKARQPAYSYDVVWADIDNDGKLDLLFANERGASTMYRNYGDSIGTIPLWQSGDSSQFSNSLAVGDVNSDGYIDLAIADNNQLGGGGHYKIYLNNGGTLSATPYWTSEFSGMGSGIALLDVTHDGWRDLVGGGWWESCRLFRNLGGVFSKDPSWTSSTTSVVEAITAGDVDNARLDTQRVAFVGDGSRKLFEVPGAPVQRLISVSLGQTVLPLTAYCYDLIHGWISFADAPPRGDTLLVEAVMSYSLDLAVSNWDIPVGNYLFLNYNGTAGVAWREEQTHGFDILQSYPNPFNGQTSITYLVPSMPVQSPGFGRTKLVIYDLSGREVAMLVDRPEPPGEYTVHFDASRLPSGVYFYRLHAGGRVVAKRMVLTK